MKSTLLKQVWVLMYRDDINHLRSKYFLFDGTKQDAIIRAKHHCLITKIKYQNLHSLALAHLDQEDIVAMPDEVSAKGSPTR